MRKLELAEDERRVAVLIAQGVVRQQIASKLGISISHLGRIIRSIFAKTGTQSTNAAIALLVVRGDLMAYEFIDPTLIPRQGDGGEASRLVQTRIMTELDADKLAGLSDAYRALVRAGL